MFAYFSLVFSFYKSRFTRHVSRNRMFIPVSRIRCLLFQNMAHRVLSARKVNLLIFLVYTELQTARIHLSSSASSVPVESMFSTAGLVANSKRSSLSADKLHRIWFIHDNFKFVWQFWQSGQWIFLINIVLCANIWQPCHWLKHCSLFKFVFLGLNVKWFLYCIVVWLYYTV